MTRPDPLVDELSDEAKADLAVIFRQMRAQFFGFDVERQRFHNKTWNLYR
jgi:hypothetical protein